MESKSRSLIKAVTWRIVATLTTMLIAWLLVGDVTVALSIGAIEFIAKFIIYYYHERAWDRIRRG